MKFLDWTYGVSFSPLQASLQVTRAVKFQRISMEGGYSAENMAILVDSCKDVSSRLALCSRVVKASLPLSK